AFEHRVAADAREAADALPGHRHGAAVAAHHQAVVAAHQLALAHGAERERGAAVRAEVLHRGGAALSVAVQAHRQAADAPPQRLALDFVRGTGHVPGVQRKHADPLGLGSRRGAAAAGGGRREAGGGRRRLELLTIRSYVEEPVKIGRPRVEAPGGGPMRRPADPRPAPAPGGKLLTITNCCGLLDPGVAGRRRMTTGGTMGQAVREPAGRTAWLTLALCCAVSVFEGYDLQAAGVVAPRVRAAFDLGPDQLGWFFSAATFGLML